VLLYFFSGGLGFGASLDNFATMKRFNPDSSWRPIVEESE
jgi:hypothetical protein